MKKATFLLSATSFVSFLLFAQGPALAQPVVQAFTASLHGAQEVPPTDATALGSALVTFNGATRELCVNLSFTPLGSMEMAAHIHGPAVIGQNAGILFPLSLGNPKLDCFGPLTTEQVRWLRQGRLYFNIHSAVFPGGEVRGQIFPQRGLRFPTP